MSFAIHLANTLDATKAALEATIAERDAQKARADAAEAKVVRLEAALKPFSRIAEGYSDQEDDDVEIWKDFDELGTTLPLKIFRRARAALAGEAAS